MQVQLLAYVPLPMAPTADQRPRPAPGALAAAAAAMGGVVGVAKALEAEQWWRTLNPAEARELLCAVGTWLAPPAPARGGELGPGRAALARRELAKGDEVLHLHLDLHLHLAHILPTSRPHLGRCSTSRRRRRRGRRRW